MLSPDSNTQIRNLKPSGHNRGKTPLIVFILGVAVSFMTLGVSNNSKIKNSTNKLENQAMVTPVNEDSFTAAPKSTYIEPLFGEFAVAKCHESCNAKQREYIISCKDDCSRLQLNNFGRRASAVEKNISQDINETITKCTETKIKFPLSSSNTQWEINTQRIIDNALSYEDQCHGKGLADLKILNNKLINSSNFLSLNPTTTETKEKETELVKNLSTLFCLYTNTNIARMGGKIAEQNVDPAGANYYKEFVNGLKPKTSELRKVVLKEVAELKLKN